MGFVITARQPDCPNTTTSHLATPQQHNTETCPGTIDVYYNIMHLKMQMINTTKKTKR